MVKVTGLPPADEVSGNEQFPMVQNGQTRRGGVQPVVQKLAMPYVAMASEEADRSEAAALSATLVAIGMDVYQSLEELEADPDVPSDGTAGGFVVTEDGDALVAVKEAEGARELTRFTTRSSLRNHGINLWEEVKRAWLGSDVESDWVATTDAVKQVMADARAWGVGKVNCGGRDKVYVCGGDYVSYGTLDLREKGQPETTIDFRRGRIPMLSGVELCGNSRASRAKFLAAPGDHNPGGLFFVPFWEDLENDKVEDVGFRWVELDGNMANQTYSAYAAGTSDAHMWIQGHAISGGAVHRLQVYESRIHGWWGHGTFGWSALAEGKTSNDWSMIGNDIFNNMQGGAQIALSRFHSERNWYHGDGGWTALGPNIEVHSEDESFFDIVSLNDIFDGRDGLSTVIATSGWQGVGFGGYDTDSAEALAARVHYRRGLWISGNYYTLPDANVFQRQRGRISIIHPKCWQSNIGCAGADRVAIDSPMIETTYEDVSRHWPMATEAIRVSPAKGELAVTGFDQATIRNAITNHDMDNNVILVSGFRKIDVTGQITGGRGAGVRVEACGGRVAVDVENVGTVRDREAWQEIIPTLTDEEADNLIGSSSAAVTVFGSRGPLTVDVQAVENRAGGARQLTHAVYANVDTAFPVRVSGSATGMLDDKWRNINNNAIDIGLIDQADRRVELNVPLNPKAGLEAEGEIEFRSTSGDLNINLRSPDGTGRKISFFDSNGLEAQIHQLADGNLQINMFDDGAAVGTPFVISNDGHWVTNWGWQNAVAIRPGAGGIIIGWLWMSEDQVVRVSATRPTADDDGQVVGDQTDGA